MSNRARNPLTRKMMFAAAFVMVSTIATLAAFGPQAISLQRLLTPFVGASVAPQPAFKEVEHELHAEPPARLSMPSGALATARSGHTATLLADGKVLVVGGSGDTSAEIVDPADGTAVATGNTNYARTGHTATRLSDGRVLIVGGGNAASEIFDPASGTFSTGPSMSADRSGHTATALSNGNVVITGGGTDRVLVFDGASFTNAGTLTESRTNHSAAAMNDGRVFIAGGTGSDTAEIYNPADGTSVATGNPLAHARAKAHLRVLPDGKVQIIGGNDDVSMEVYDPAIDTVGAHVHLLPDTDTCTGLRSGVRDSQTRAALFFAGNADAAYDRTGHTITEVSGNRALVIGGTTGGNASNTVTDFASSPATITTDKLDYAPGETVTFNGTGFSAGETVRVVIHEDPHTHLERNFEATADASGNITGSYLVEEHDLNVKFIVNARGLTSNLTAQAAFTDSRTITGVTLNGASTVTVAPGASITAAVTVLTDNGGGNNDWQGTRWRIATTVPGTTTCVNTPDHTTSGTFTESFSITAPATAGTYNAYFLAYQDNGCANGASALFTLTNSVIVDGTNPTVTSIDRADTNPTNGTSVSWNVTFSEDVSGVDAADFALASTGLSGATITGVTGTGATRTVTADTGNGTGTLGLNLVDNDTIQDAATNKLGGAGAGNGNFTGQIYNLDRTLTPVITVDDKTYDGNTAATILTRTFTGFNLPGVPVTVEVTGGTANFADANAGVGKTVNITGLSLSGAGSERFILSSTSATATADIDKADAAVVVTPYDVPYDGQPHTATVTSIIGVNGETGATVGSVDVSGTTHTNAGTYNNDPWTFTGTANYNDTSGTVNNQIDKADAIVVVNPYDVVYNGLPQTSTYTVTGVNGETGATVGTVDVSATTHTNAGTYNGDAWTFTGTANYNNTSGTVDNQIDKADAAVVVTPYDVVYDGLPHTATVTSITGVNGETGATVGAVDVSGTTHTNAGTYNNDPWTFTGTANYNDTSGTVNDQIDKADASVVVNPYDVVYNALPQTSTYTITGVNGETGATVGTVDVSGTTHTNAGTYNNDPWTFTGTANYNDTSGTVNNQIDKANAVVVVTPYDVTYDGLPHTATVTSITGVGGETGATVGTVDVSATIHTNAGTYNDSWSFTGTANYNDQLNIAITNEIDKANSTTTVACPPGPYTYTGSPIVPPCTYTVIGNELSNPILATGNIAGVDHTNNVNAGTASAGYTFAGDANHNGSNGTDTFTIDKAGSTTTVTCPPGTYTYTGSPIVPPCTYLVIGNEAGNPVLASGSVAPGDHTNNVNAGTASASYSFAGDGNHNGSNNSDTFVIQKATPTATLAVNNSPVTYNGSPQSATVGISASSVPGTVANVTNGTHTNAGTYAVTADFIPNDTNNYNTLTGLSAGDFVIDKATPTATLAVNNSPVTYNNNPQSATVGISASSVPGTVANVTNGTHTNAGTYAVTADFVPTDTANYNSLTGLAAGNFVIDKATPTATLAVDNSPVTYNGGPQSATVAISASSVPGAVANVTNGTHTNAGTYAVTADFTPTDTTNYNTLTGLSAGDFVIDKATPTATLAVNNSPVTYNGSPQSATVGILASSIPGAVANVTNSSHTDAGTYPVSADFVPTDTDNYNTLTGLSAGDFVIQKATPTATLVVTNSPVTYDGSSQSATVGISASSVSGAVANVANGTHTNAGTYPVTADFVPTDTDNYNTLAGLSAGDFVIDKAGSTTTVSCPANVTYTGSAIEPCTYTVVGNETGNPVLVAAGTAVPTADYLDNTNSGTASVNITFAGDANHETSNDSANFTIDKAGSTTTVTCPANVTYTGSAIEPCTYTVTGNEVGNPVIVASTAVPSGNYTNNTNAGTASASFNFAGDSNHNGSSDSKNFTIEKADSTTTVTCPPGPYTFTGSAIVPPCTFEVKGNETGTPVLASGNVAAGDHTNNVNAGTATASHAFAGDSNHGGSNDTETFTIAKRNTLTTISSSLNPTVFGQNVTFTATVVGSGAGAGNPTGGSVQFKIDSVNFGAPVALVGGSATSGTTNTLTTGNHAVEAIFTSSDTNFNNSSDLLDGGQNVSRWTLNGFYQPVGTHNTYSIPNPSPIVWNTIKGGQTVPLKFNIFAGTVEKTSVTDIAYFTAQDVPCNSVPAYAEDSVDVTTTGGTTLRYSGTPGVDGQFIQNWQTPKAPDKCYRVIMRTQDGSYLMSFFKTKK